MNIYLGQIWIRHKGIPSRYQYKLVEAENTEQAQRKMEDYARNKISFIQSDKEIEGITIELITVESPL